MFLTSDEVERLTGRKRPKDQAMWLAQKGYRFKVNAVGDVVVLRAEVNRQFGLDSTPDAPDQSPNGEKNADLNWSAMAKRGMLRARGTSKNI